MNARAAGQATVRCDSEYTWSLCDGDACTAMGGVAGAFFRRPVGERELMSVFRSWDGLY